MDEEIKKLLDEEIATEIRGLSDMESGSDKKSKEIKDIVALCQLRIDEEKIELDADDKYNRLVKDDEVNKRDCELKKIQIDEQTKDRYFRVGIAVAELMIPLIFYGVWMNKGFKFEETGTYTSTTFKGLFNRFRPTKK